MKNHYEILGVNKDATKVEIKDAYLDLSKQYHPDRNPTDPDLHHKFVQIKEAYIILSKDSTRTSYDLNLQFQESQGSKSTSSAWVRTQAPSEPLIWKDESIWEMRDRSHDRRYRHESYYGFSGVKRLPNSYIVAGILTFTILGCVGHYVAAKYLGEKHKRDVEEMERKHTLIYLGVRAKAKDDGNELQVESLRQRIQSNPD